MKKILIIGENSYIGNSFLRYVHNEVQIYNKDKWIIEKIGASKGQWRTKDFTGYDTILHVAALVHKKENKQMEKLYNSINYDLAVEVAKKAKDSGVSQFVFLSTMAVYGRNVERITKDTIPTPNTYYGKSKLAAENELIKIESENFRVAIVRPPMVYGEGCKGNFEKLAILARILPIFPEYNNKRSMIYINNLNEAIVVIIKNSMSGVFHPQNEEYVDTSKLFISIRNTLHRKTVLIKGFELIIGFLTRRIRILHKILGSCYYDYDLSNYMLSINSYCKVNFEKSLKNSLMIEQDIQRS